jgi:hypothetical protein
VFRRIGAVFRREDFDPEAAGTVIEGDQIVAPKSDIEQIGTGAQVEPAQLE